MMKQDAEQEILVDDRARAARKLHQERQPAQVVVHQRNRRAVDRHFAARRAHRDADVARRQRRARRSRRRRRPRLCSLSPSWRGQTQLCSAAGNRPWLLRSRFPRRRAWPPAGGRRKSSRCGARRLPSIRPALRFASARVWSCKPTQPMHLPSRATKIRLQPSVSFRSTDFRNPR